MNRNKKTKPLNMRSSVRTLSIKVYDEQLPQGWDAVKNNIRSIDKSLWQVIGICHDRDYCGDDFWAPAIEKKHYHIIVRVLNGKNARVEQILRQIGIVYRPEVDKSLWENHGVETCADYTAMSVYLTHETEQAILDGKAKYELEELVSNLTLEEIKQVREGYTRVSDSGEKVTPRRMAELDKDAYELGYNLRDFGKWYGSLPFNVRSHAKMHTVRESYDRGKEDKIQELRDGKRIPRICVFIQSPKGMGKSCAAEYALQKLGVRYLNPSGGGTGMFDKLEPTHGGIIIDDDTCPHLLQMADTKIYDAYKRGNGNPPWCGEYLIVTSNDSFRDWLAECGFRSEQKIEAAEDRFYICHLETIKGSGRSVLVCSDRAKRGGDDSLQDGDEKYNTFRQYFNESLAAYRRSKTGRERIDINSVELTPEEQAAYDADDAAKEEKRKAEETAAKKAEEDRKRLEEEKKKNAFWSALYYASNHECLEYGKAHGWDNYPSREKTLKRLEIQERMISEYEESRKIGKDEEEPAADMVAEFEESIAEPDEYIEAVMLAMHMADCA